MVWFMLPTYANPNSLNTFFWLSNKDFLVVLAATFPLNLFPLDRVHRKQFLTPVNKDIQPGWNNVIGKASKYDQRTLTSFTRFLQRTSVVIGQEAPEEHISLINMLSLSCISMIYYHLSST